MSLPTSLSENPIPSARKFQLRLKGINPDKLVELQGERGPFYVGLSGSMPEMENGLFYGDDRHQFCFYTHLIADQSVTTQPQPYDLEVYYATPQTLAHLRGSLGKIPKADVEYIERNITHLFRTRRFSIPSQPVNPNDSPREIRFTWRISK